MPRVPPAHLEARRRGILKAAQRCFVRRGLHATTIRDICRAANLSPGAVYSYFDSKQAIIEALARESRERMAAFVASLDGRERPLEALLTALARPEAAEWLRLDVALWAEALQEGGTRPLFVAAADSLTSAVAELVRREQERGRLSGALDPGSFARLVLALFDGLALHQAADPELDPRPAVRALLALLASAP